MSSFSRPDAQVHRTTVVFAETLSVTVHSDGFPLMTLAFGGV